MTLTIAQAVTVAVLAISCFLCGWSLYRLRAKGREAALQRTVTETKATIPQLEAALRSRDQRIATLGGDIEQWKGRISALENGVREKERDVLARDRALRSLNAELMVLREAAKQASASGASALSIDERASAAAPPVAPSGELSSLVEQLNLELAVRERTISELEQRLRDASAHGGSLGTMIEAKDAELVQAREEINKWRARVPKLVESLKERDDRLVETATRTAAFEQDLGVTQRKLDELERASEGSRVRIAEQERALGERDRMLAEKDGQIAQLAHAAEEARGDFARKLATSIRLGREEIDRMSRELSGELDRMTRELGDSITRRNDALEEGRVLRTTLDAQHQELGALRAASRDAQMQRKANAERIAALEQGLAEAADRGRALEARHAETSGELEQVRGRTAEIERAAQSARAELDATTRELRAQRERDQGLQAECERLTSRIAQLEGDLDGALARSQRFEDDARDAHTQREALAKTLDERAGEALALREELRGQHIRVAPLEELVKQHDAALSERATSIEMLKDQVAKLEAALTERAKRIAELERSAVAAPGKERAETHEKIEYLEQRVAAQFDRNRELSVALEDRDRTIADLTRDRTLKDKSLAVLQQQLEQVNQANDRLSAELRELKTRVDGSGGGSDGALPEAPRDLFRMRPDHVDDLQQIRGIGAAFQQKLNELGIYQLKQIAGLNEAEICWVENELKMFRGRIGRDDWIGQALDLMAKENWMALPPSIGAAPAPPHVAPV